MDDKIESISSLLHRLCEVTFLNEASKKADAYSKVLYTKLTRKKLQTRLYEKLFMDLQAPWVKTDKKVRKYCRNTDCKVYEQIVVRIFRLRSKREFDKADLLEYYCQKWKSFSGSTGSLTTTETGEAINICSTNEVLRFIVALSDTGQPLSSTVLGHQNVLYPATSLPKEINGLLPKGPLLYSDSSRIKHGSLLKDKYVLYSRDLFENLQTVSTHVSTGRDMSIMFPQILNPAHGRNRFFAIQETGEVLHDKRTRLTVFGALSHGYTADMQVKLGLPDLPQSSEKVFGISSISSQSTDDEGFHELTESTFTSEHVKSESCSTIEDNELDIWTEALKLPIKKCYTWEMEGRRDGLTDCPYITEAGPEVFDELYNLISKQVSYLTKTAAHYRMASVKILTNHSLDVLIGVPTTTFLFNMDTRSLNVNPEVRLSGCSPESLHTTLSKLASIGTSYQNLVSFITHKEQTGGLVLHAFLGGLRNYLQCYKSIVLNIRDSSIQSPFQLSFIFQNIGRQLRFLADVCMCSSHTRSGGSSRTCFPTGVKLLSYLYKLCLEHSSANQYPVLLSLLKHSCAPYILFVQQWVFQGICQDVYEEFIIEVDDQFLAYRDKHFWSHGFIISERDKLDCVPLFLSELANDIFVCGKSINLMKLCNPGHFLCHSGVPPPKMEVTFSMSKLKAIDQNCEDYVQSIKSISNAIKRKKEQQRIAIEQAKEKMLMEDRQRAEKALAEVTGLIDKVKEAIDRKKKADLKMLKEQMEEAIKKRQLDKKHEDEIDNQFMVDALNQAAADVKLREKARQDLIDYYQKLTEEMDRREEQAHWKIKRLELNKRRMEFFAKEEVKLEKDMKEAAKELSKPDIEVKTEEIKTNVVSVDSPNASQQSEQQTIQGLSPSIVSLIASGIKTDSLVQLESNKLTAFSSATDSGLGQDKATSVIDGEVSEAHTLHSATSLDDEDDTDISVASLISAPSGRKKWSSTNVMKADDLKKERLTSRRIWESPDNNIHLAESPFPHGHPSESSIQFSLYADKNIQDEDTKSTVVVSSIETNSPNPSDSSVQNIMYPSTVALTQGVSNYNDILTSDKHNSPSQSADKDIQGSSQSYGPPKEDPVIQDFIHSLSVGLNNLRTAAYQASSSFGHPSDSTVQTILYGNEEIPSTHQTQHRLNISENVQIGETNIRGRSASNQPSGSQLDSFDSVPTKSFGYSSRQLWGHPSNSQFDSDGAYLLESTLSGHRSPVEHPSDTQLDSSRTHLPGQENERQIPSRYRSPYGHPSDTRLDSSELTPHKALQNQFGHPSDCSIQNLFISTMSVSEEKESLKKSSPFNILHPETTRGTPPVDSLKDIIYPGDGSVRQDRLKQSIHGHEPDVKIVKLMYPLVNEKEEPAPEQPKPLVFEDTWISSEVQPLQLNFDILDKQPMNDLLKSALSAIPIGRDDLGDNDIIDAAWLTSLPVLLRRSVTAPLIAQISLVNSSVVEYFMEDLKLMEHFEVFRKFLLMEDGEFSLSLSDQLFEKLSSGVNPREMCSPTTMNAIITQALQLSVYGDKTGFEQGLSFALKSLPDAFNMNDIGVLDFLELRYRVPWPVNIIITENSIIKYNKVFSFMLRLKRVAWVLQEIWFHLKHVGFSQSVAGSPQLRQLQLFRHEMLHFVQNIDGYLSNQILNVTWAEFQQELITNACDLDELHHRHTEYLNKAVFRSLLSKKATSVMKIINDMFSLVLKFRTQLLSCPWQQDGASGHMVHPRFDVMFSTHKAFKEYSGFLFTVLSKLVRRGYQSHLQDFLLRLNFNDFYKTS